MITNGYFPIQYVRYNSNHQENISGNIIVEAPVSLTINGEVWITFMCTPTDLEALAVGFAFNEKLINSLSEVEYVHVCDSKENVDLWLNHAVEQPKSWMKTSGCTGGFTSIGQSQINHASISNGRKLSSEEIYNLVARLYTDQQLYKVSGGVHTSCLTDGGEILIISEDIGRHNTLDKIAGRCLIDGIDIIPKIILSTGRISSEMLQKAARMGASFVISRTSPSSLSIKLADQLGITLIGYVHRNQFNIYAHPERVINDRIIKPSLGVSHPRGD